MSRSVKQKFKIFQLDFLSTIIEKSDQRRRYNGGAYRHKKQTRAKSNALYRPEAPCSNNAQRGAQGFSL